MKTAVTLLSLAASAAAFAPSVSNNGRAGSIALQETKADLESLAGALNPNVGFYDPLMLSDYEFWGDTNEATIGFLRHSEIK
jgi:hypothetical protein